MKHLLVLPVVLLLAACAGTSSGGGGEVRYRYVNTLDFGKDNTLDTVTVTGTDEQDLKEATRLDVKIGDQAITLRDLYEGKAGAMYNPGVQLAADGALLVRWTQMGETACEVEIVSGPGGKLVERKRTLETP